MIEVDILLFVCDEVSEHTMDQRINIRLKRLQEERNIIKEIKLNLSETEDTDYTGRTVLVTIVYEAV